jgi:Secretion system C-terminal sorting domain
MSGNLSNLEIPLSGNLSNLEIPFPRLIIIGGLGFLMRNVKLNYQRILQVFLLVGLSLIGNNWAQAQRDWNWTFGDSILMKFPGGANPFVDTTVKTKWFLEMSASISDSNGNLLFYMNADSIYNSRNSAYSNSNLYFSHFSFTQGGLILPLPDVEHTYYAIYIGSIGILANQWNLRYFKLDFMKIEEGEILTFDSIFYFSPVPMRLSEKLTATRHSNGKDWWLIGHQSGSDSLIVFELNESGFFSIATTSIGSDYSDFGGNCCQQMGEMSFSPDGTKLVAACAGGYIDLFDFDRCTGQLSNYRQLGQLANGDGNHTYYGSSFSPNNRFLYVSEGLNNQNGNHLYQFDTEAPDVLASKVEIYHLPADNTEFGQHQLGPDGKIYIGGGNALDSLHPSFYSLSVINNPDLPGLACNFSNLGFSLNGRRGTIGLPNLPNYNLAPVNAQIAELPDTLWMCEGDSILIGEPNTSGGKCVFVWSGSSTISKPTAAQAWVSPVTDATFILTVADTTMNSCAVTTDTVRVVVIPAAEIPFADAGGDTVICAGDTAMLGVTGSAAWDYLWTASNGDTVGQAAQIIVSDAGSYFLKVEHGTGAACAAATDSVTVGVIAECDSVVDGVWIYPNPFDDVFYIKVVAVEPSVEIGIYNMLGQVVTEQDYYSDQAKVIEVDGNGLAAGVYVVRVEVGRRVVYRRMVKSN